MPQNAEQSFGVLIDLAACSFCAPSIRPEPENNEMEEVQDEAVTMRRPSLRPRRVVSSSDEEVTMPLTRSRQAKLAQKQKTSGRARSKSRGTARSKSRPNARQSSRSRSKSASKPSASRRGRKH